MKVLISSTVFFLFSFSGTGQVDTSIIGVWKIVSIYKDGIYYNFKTDSISLSKENKAKYSDKAVKQELITGFKTFFPTMRYHFESGGVFKQTMDREFVFDGTYRKMAQQDTIEITTRNSLNENVTEKVKCIFVNGLLRLSMDWEGDMFDLVLEKER